MSSLFPLVASTFADWFADGSDAQSWYLLGRAYMAGQRYNKAYEAYQQAVYRDGRNPTFWCSIGVLYYQINQYRDALDAYSRAIRLNPYISEVWFNLGSLYESCNNQVTDAIDAYSRAAELDPNNPVIKARLGLLTTNGSNTQLPPPPGPIDVHPSQYSAQGATGQLGGSPNHSPRNGPADGRLDGPPPPGRDLPPPPPGGDFARGHSPGPFRGGAAPPPLQIVDESRGSMSRHAPLAPMEIDRTEVRDGREGPPPGFNGGPPRLETMDRRHVDAPTSPPRRRSDYPAQYPQYPGQHRDRERDDWERRERAARGPPGGPGPDPRGPSPRLPEYRAPGHHQPSPRIPSDPRDHGRYPYAESSQGHHPMQQGMYQNDPRYDSRRERERDRDDRMDGRGPSQAREDPRAHSPAPSTASRVSAKRKQKEDEASRSGSKRPKDELKPSSKKASSTNGNGERKNGRPSGSQSAASPRPTVASSPAYSAAEVAPRRALDEGKLHTHGYLSYAVEADNSDYDGAGAVDALMSLHSDRRSEPRSGSQSPVNPMSAVAGGIKRSASPPKQDSLESVKRAKNSGSDSPARRTVIEVLNTPNVDSPLAKADGASGSDGYFKPTTDKQPADASNAPKVAEEVKEDAGQEQTPAASEPATKEVSEEAPASADSVRPDTPPVEAAPAAPAAAANEDVTMAESDAPAATESTTEAAAATAPPPAASPAPESTTAATTETVPATESLPETDTAQPMDVDAPSAPVESTEAAPAPAPTTTETTEPASEAPATTVNVETNEEKKEE